MVDRLQNLLKNSYAPYSNFHVAAIVEMQDGQTFEGVNVENASYGGTICAERNAILSAVTKGYRKKDFKKLYVMVDSDKISSCCFICRQMIVEFFEDDEEIILMNKLGDEQRMTVKELCPMAFTEGDLK